MNTNGFIRIPNSVVGNLKGYRCILYIYLLYLCTVQKTNRIKVKLETCRRHIGASFTTAVCRQMHALEKAGYVKIENNYDNFGLQTCNTVTVHNFDPKKDYFLIPSDHISLQIPPSAFELMLTLYMFSYQDSFCFPSLTQIRKASHLGRSTIVQGCRILEEKGIIIKENYMRRDGSYGHNRYFFMSKLERLAGEDKAVKFITWIRKQKKVCFELWQIIKEVLTGNTAILDEICVCIEAEQEFIFDKGKPCTDTHISVFSCPGNDKENIAFRESIGGSLKKKISRVQDRLRLIFSRVFHFFKRAVL